MQIAWDQAGTLTAGPDDPGYRRERMRQFHRRARPSAGAD